jgi:hypothetical protein
MNPDGMRGSYGKLVYMLQVRFWPRGAAAAPRRVRAAACVRFCITCMICANAISSAPTAAAPQDAVSERVRGVLGFDVRAPVKTVAGVLGAAGAEALLDDPLARTATREIESEGRARHAVDKVSFAPPTLPQLLQASLCCCCDGCGMHAPRGRSANSSTERNTRSMTRISAQKPTHARPPARQSRPRARRSRSWRASTRAASAFRRTPCARACTLSQTRARSFGPGSTRPVRRPCSSAAWRERARV